MVAGIDAGESGGVVIEEMGLSNNSFSVARLFISPCNTLPPALLYAVIFALISAIVRCPLFNNVFKFPLPQLKVKLTSALN